MGSPKKYSGCDFIYVEQKTVRPAHLLFYITEVQGRSNKNECLFPSQSSSTTFMSIAAPNFFCGVKIVSFCETRQSLSHLSTHPHKHTCTENFKESFLAWPIAFPIRLQSTHISLRIYSHTFFQLLQNKLWIMDSVPCIFWTYSEVITYCLKRTWMQRRMKINSGWQKTREHLPVLEGSVQRGVRKCLASRKGVPGAREQDWPSGALAWVKPWESCMGGKWKDF